MLEIELQAITPTARHTLMESRQIFNLNSITSNLGRFRKILVTGPQRSGTTIAAEIIAAETAMPYVDERSYGWRDLAALSMLVANDERMVIQYPNFAHIIEQFTADDICIVFMHRQPTDILQSQKRINWKSASYQRKLYRGKVPYINHWLTPVCVIKYLHWHLHQKSLVLHSLDLPYHSLKQHPRWVEQPRRSMFTSKQTA